MNPNQAIINCHTVYNVTADDIRPLLEAAYPKFPEILTPETVSHVLSGINHMIDSGSLTAIFYFRLRHLEFSGRIHRWALLIPEQLMARIIGDAGITRLWYSQWDSGA